MSVQATSWVYEHSKATGADRLVLLAIADAANKEGRNSCQSAATLAKMSAASERTVWRCIARLEAAGEIIKTGFHGTYKTSIYDLPGVACGQGVKMSPPVIEDTDPLTSVQDSLTSVQEPYDTDGTLPHLYPSTTPTNNPKADAAAPPADKHPADLIAKKSHDATNGALPYMGIRGIAKWAIDRNGSTPAETEAAIADLWRRGRPVTKQTVAQTLRGAPAPAGKPTVGDKMRDTIQRAQALQARADQAKTNRLQIGA